MRRLPDVGTAKLLAQIPLLAGLEHEEQELIAPLIELRRYRARQTIVWEGEGGGSLFHVLSGYLKATTAGADGQELLLSIMGPGEVFGELSLLDGQPRSASVTTLEAVHVATLDRAPFLQLLERSPKLASSLLSVIAQRLRNLSRRAENVACLDVRGRLAQVLIFLADKYGRTVAGGVEIPFKMSQRDLGSMVGATRESVNKLLGDFGEAGIVFHVAGTLKITNLPALRRVFAH